MGHGFRPAVTSVRTSVDQQHVTFGGSVPSDFVLVTHNLGAIPKVTVYTGTPTGEGWGVGGFGVGGYGVTNVTLPLQPNVGAVVTHLSVNAFQVVLPTPQTGIITYAVCCS